MKSLLKRVVGENNLTFEEMSTVLCQVESCLNSRPLVPLNSPNDDGIEALTPGHFLIGKPLEALPDQTDVPNQTNILQKVELVSVTIQGILVQVVKGVPAIIKSTNKMV